MQTRICRLNGQQDIRIETLEDFVEAAKADPAELPIDVPLLSSPQHPAIIAIGHAYGIDVNIVPYDAGAPTMSALLGD